MRQLPVNNCKYTSDNHAAINGYFKGRKPFLISTTQNTNTMVLRVLCSDPTLHPARIQPPRVLHRVRDRLSRRAHDTQTQDPGSCHGKV